jgi:hypothetical protein
MVAPNGELKLETVSFPPAALEARDQLRWLVQDHDAWGMLGATLVRLRPSGTMLPGTGPQPDPLWVPLPFVGDHLRAVILARGHLVVSVGKRLLSYPAPGQPPRVVQELDYEGRSLAAAADGTLLVFAADAPLRCGILAAKHPDSLATRWEILGLCAQPIWVEGRSVFAIRETRKDLHTPAQYAFVRIDLGSGKVQAELPLAGSPVTPMARARDTIMVVVQDGTGSIGKATDRLVYEQIDVATWKRTSVALPASQNGFGDVYSSMMAVPACPRDPCAIIAVNGERGRLLRVRAGRAEEVAFPAAGRNLGTTSALVEVGKTLALVTENEATRAADLHLFDAASLAHQRTIHILRPGDASPALARLGADLVLPQRGMVLLRAVTTTTPIASRLRYLEARPWELSNGNHLVDGDPKTSYTVFGFATVSLAFAQPMLVPGLTLLLGQTRKAGRLASVRTTEIPCEGEPVAAAPGSKRVQALPGPVLTEQMVLELRCASTDRREPEPKCDVAELSFEPPP